MSVLRFSLVQAEEHVLHYPRQNGNGRDFADTVYRDQQRRESDYNDNDYSPSPAGSSAPPGRSNGPDPKVAGYQAYVEKHIDRFVSQNCSNTHFSLFLWPSPFSVLF